MKRAREDKTDRSVQLCRLYGTWVVYEIFLGVSIGDVTGWEELIPVGLSSEGSDVSYLVGSNGVRGRV